MRIICLNVPEDTERRVQAEAHFRERGVTVEWMDGINAKVAGLFTTHPYLHNDPERGGHIIPQGQVGVALSHIMAWTVCQFLDDPCVMIVEDDVDFPEDWRERLSGALFSVPKDADMLYVGSCNCADKPTLHIAGDVFEVKWPFCTHAYIVWKKALPVMLATQRKIYAPVDLALYFETLPKLRVYTVLPTIALQRGTPLSP